MAKSAGDDLLDALLIELATATLMTVCSAEPTTRTEAVTTFALADVTPTFAAIGNGTPNGRSRDSEAKSGVTVDASGTATHVAWVDATVLLAVTTCTSQVLTSGNTVNIPAVTFNVADPT